MAGFALVSHCYRRPTYDDWPYSIFTMVHGKNAKECETTIAAIHDETGVDEYALLWSVKEYKKTRVRYFTDDWDDWRAEHLPPDEPRRPPAEHVDRRRARSGPTRPAAATSSTSTTRARRCRRGSWSTR